MFCTVFGVWGDDFFTKNLNFKKKKLFYVITFNFLIVYSSINLKRQSEHSGLRLDTSSLVKYYQFYSMFWFYMEKILIQSGDQLG